VRYLLGARRQRPIAPHRLLAALVTLVVAVALAAPVAYADSHRHHGGHAHHAALQHRAKRVHGRIRRVSGDIGDVSSRVARISTALKRQQHSLVHARASLVTTQRRLAVVRRTALRLRGRLRAAQGRLDVAQAKAAAARRSVDVQREVAKRTIIGLAAQGDPGLAMLSSYLDDGSLDDVMMSQTGNDMIAGRQTRAIAALQSVEDTLDARKDRVRDARDHVRGQKVVAQAKLKQMWTLVIRAAHTKRKVKRLIVSTKRTRAAAVRARRSDQAKLRVLRSQEARIQRKITAATAGDRNRHVGNVHGMFYVPVRHTYITSPYGWRINPIYHYWGLHDGDDLAAPCGTPERAAGAGKVVAQYYSDVWGHRLYLDLGRINGHHFVAIYNHISAYRSKVGQRVAADQTIALAGTTGWSTGCHLHFTLMRDGRAINPAPYIGM